jgi:hypothetical protein
MIARNSMLTFEDVDAIFRKYGNFELDKAIKEIE